MVLQFTDRSHYKLLTLFLLLIQAISQTAIQTTTIRDLQRSLPQFTQQANAWTATTTTASSLASSDCNGQNMLGGFGILLAPGSFERTYPTLKSHITVFFVFEFALIDNWRSTDKLLVKVQSTTFTVDINHDPATEWAQNYCGSSSYKDVMPIHMIGRIAHSSTDLTIKVSKTNTNSDAQFAIRDISIILTDQVLTDSAVVRTETPNAIVNTKICPIDRYGGGCLQCHASCATCYNVAADQCMSCKPGYSYMNSLCVQCHSSCQTCYGTNENQCFSCPDGKYLHPNSTCSSTCDPPYRVRNSNGELFCELCTQLSTYEVPAAASSYYYPADQICQATCEAPFRIRSVDLYCQLCTEANTANYNLVSSGTLYYYPSGQTCQPACPAPYRIRQYGNYSYCELCTEANTANYNLVSSGTLYYYPALKICQPVCSFPYSIVESGGNFYCQLCTPYNTADYSLVSSGILYYYAFLTACRPVCEAPLKIREVNGDYHCELCNEFNTYNYYKYVTSGMLYYYPDDQTCKPICPKPYKIERTYFCVLPLTEEQMKQIEGLGTAAITGSNVMTLGVIALTVASPSSSNGVAYGSLGRMFEYTRYYDVTRPVRLEAYYKVSKSTPGTTLIGPPLSNETVAEFQYHEVPEAFVKSNVHSSFLVNFYIFMQSLLIIAGAVLLVLVLEKLIVRRWKKRAELLEKVRLAALSYLIMQFYNVYTEIFFFSTLEWFTYKSGDARIWISLALSVFFCLFGLFVLHKHTQLIRSYQAFKKQIAEAEDKDKKLEQFQNERKNTAMLHTDFKDKTFFHQAYLLLLTFRTVVYAVVMVVLSAHPIVQATINVFMNAAGTVYLLSLFPQKNVFGVFQQILYELDILLVNVCFLIMAIMEANGTDSPEVLEKLGNAVILAIFISKFIVVVTVLPKIYQGAKPFVILFINKIKLKMGKGKGSDAKVVPDHTKPEAPTSELKLIPIESVMIGEKIPLKPGTSSERENLNSPFSLATLYNRHKKLDPEENILEADKKLSIELEGDQAKRNTGRIERVTPDTDRRPETEDTNLLSEGSPSRGQLRIPLDLIDFPAKRISLLQPNSPIERIKIRQSIRIHSEAGGFNTPGSAGLSDVDTSNAAKQISLLYPKSPIQRIKIRESIRQAVRGTLMRERPDEIVISEEEA